MNESLNAYERVLIQPTRGFHVFLYAAHFNEANCLQVGFGVESVSGLQRSHISGPSIHEAHTSAISDWLRGGGSVFLTDETIPGRQHPFSSTMTVDVPKMLEQVDEMPLSVGRFMPLVSCDLLTADATVTKFADAIDRVAIRAFGHPLDWDVQFSDCTDGRFVWMAYDTDLNKIRIGMGFVDEHNERKFGVHTYAVSKDTVGEFCAFHFYYLDSPLQFIGLPPRWPQEMEPFLYGKPKQAFATALLKLADAVWPGQVAC